MEALKETHLEAARTAQKTTPNHDGDGKSDTPSGQLPPGQVQSGGLDALVPASTFSIRSYHHSDWPNVLNWWNTAGETAPLPSMMPLESSFIAEVNGIPALAVTVYLTNTPEVAYTENFAGNPEIKGDSRKLAASLLSEHIAAFAKSRGYKRLLCMTEKPALMRRYVELGYQPTLSGVTTLVRVL